MENIWQNEELVQALGSGGVAVMPTDTIYGIVGSALDAGVVGKIYEIRKRDTSKPFIVLISDMGELAKFSVSLSLKQIEKLSQVWPGPTSVILDVADPDLEYLHRGKNSISFRVPSISELRELLGKVGPLVAPSANPQGEVPAQDISQAKNYFGDQVSVYVDGGEVKGNASRIIRLSNDGSVSIIRE